jgi:RNA 3'-terminal phosphate cyclase (ATP)
MISNTSDKLLLTMDELKIKNDTLEIDGSYLEGGGQILRVSIILSILLQKNVKIFNIRGKRSNPGLQKQHLAATKGICNMTDSKLEGAEICSKEILILTNSNMNFIKNEFKLDCNGAGSIGLLIQQILPCAIFNKEMLKIEMIGGTIVSHAPSTFYIQDVLLPILKDNMKIDFSIDLKKHGIFPIGGGLVNFHTNYVDFITPINIIQRGKLKSILFRVASTENFVKLNLEDVVKTTFKEIKKLFNSDIKSSEQAENEILDEENKFEIQTDFVKLFRTKKTFTLFFQAILYYENTIISVEQLYSEKNEQNLKSNEFTSEFINKFEENINNPNICFDEFTVDHLIIFMALAKGKSIIQIGEVSMHTLTAVEVIKKFIPEIKINVEKFDNFNRIEIEGIGYGNKNVDNFI